MKDFDGNSSHILSQITVLQTERLRVRFLIVSLEFFVDIILPVTLWSRGRCSLEQKWAPGVLPGGKGGRCVRLTNLPTFMCWMWWNLEDSNSWKPQGLSRPVSGLLQLLLYFATNNVLFYQKIRMTHNNLYQFHLVSAFLSSKKDVSVSLTVA